MAFCAVDRAACVRDHACIAVCPLGILRADREGFPRSTGPMEPLCVACGHCVAVCPRGALTVNGIPPASCEALREGSRIAPDQAAQFFKARRSVREFQERPVPRAVLEQVLEIVRYAPTGKNAQSCHWLVVESPGEIRRLSELTVDFLRQTQAAPPVVLAFEHGRDMVLRGAPCLAIAHAPEDGVTPQLDCVIALTHLELAATVFGLGACWAGFFMMAIAHHPPVAAALRLPEGHKAHGALMLGYPKHAYPRVPPRKPASVAWR